MWQCCMHLEAGGCRYLDICNLCQSEDLASENALQASTSASLDWRIPQVILLDVSSDPAQPAIANPAQCCRACKREPQV